MYPSASDAPGIEVSGGPCPPSQQQKADDIEHIAQAVAAILAPTIAAVNAGMLQIKKGLGEHASHLNEGENIASMEEELYQAQAIEQAQDKTNQYVIQKLEDSENRSRHSNL